MLFVWLQAVLVAVLALSAATTAWQTRLLAAVLIAAAGTVASYVAPGRAYTRIIVALSFTGLAALVGSPPYVLAALGALIAYADRRVILAACVLALAATHALVIIAACGAMLWIVSLMRALFVRFETQRLAAEDARRVAEQTLRQLEAQAYRDTLTGCRNRLFFMDRLEIDLARANGRGDFRFAMLFFDLDHFKSVNDTYGHHIGDLLLVEFARRIEWAIRPQDTLARIGGDEFVAIIEGIASASEAANVAARIAASLNRPFVLEGIELMVSASIGLADSIDGYATSEAMIQDADAAMYRTKRSGSAWPPVRSASRNRTSSATRARRSAHGRMPLFETAR